MGGEFHTQEAVKMGKRTHNIRMWSACGGGAGDVMGKVGKGPAYQWSQYSLHIRITGTFFKNTDACASTDQLT